MQVVNEPVAFPCDISKKEEVLRMGTQILEKFGHIDLLINNAGFGQFNKVENQSIEQIETVMRTNYFGMVYCTKGILTIYALKTLRTYCQCSLIDKSGHIGHHVGGT